MMRPVDDMIQSKGTAELSAALGHVLSGYFGGQRRIARLERRRSAYCSSFAIEELDVRLEDGTTLELIWKDLSWHALQGDARRAKRPFSMTRCARSRPTVLS